MDDKEQAAIDALRTAGLEAEANAVEQMRALQKATMDAYHAGQRASYINGKTEERRRCILLANEAANKARESDWLGACKALEAIERGA